MERPLHAEDPAVAAELESLESLLGWMVEQLGSRLGRPAESIDVGERFKSLGMDSLAVTALLARLGQRLGRTLSPTLAWEHPTPRALAMSLLGAGEAASDPAVGGVADGPRPAVDEPIAIIGLACRLPQAPSPEAFWALLRDGLDAITEVPPERWDTEALYDADPDAPGKMTSRRGGFLPDIAQFDCAFFGISPGEAERMDPQQRLLLETAWETLEHAGILPETLVGSETGVYIGQMYQEYKGLLGGLEELDGHVLTGCTASVASGRISYTLGLKGPSMTVDTACSSSLVTVHLACQALRRRECRLALAGGVALMLTPSTFVEFSRLRGPAQQEVIRKALSAAGIKAAELDYVECHGTGTALGDPIELGALGAVMAGRTPTSCWRRLRP